MSHREPFRNLRALPHDLAIGAWLVYGTIAADAWDHARPWIAQRLTAWGQRLA